MSKQVHEGLSPFDQNFFYLADLRMHYVDEGKGAPVVMVHGNPTWSFYFRRLAADLRQDHRVIVPDHIGCGLSDKPKFSDYPYTLDRRVADFGQLLKTLVPEGKITLILHDWGGMIGMAWAVRNPERVAKIVLLNTAAFRLPATKTFPWQLWLCRTPLGPLLVQKFNLFCLGTVHLCTEKPLPAEIKKAYLAPYQSWDERIAVLRFVQDIPLRSSDPSWDTIVEVEKGLSQFQDTPIQIFWGEKDFVFDRHFLAEWQRRLPHASVYLFPNAGHLVLEDEHAIIIPHVRKFLTDL
jgi:haloalkane dehalogenase